MPGVRRVMANNPGPFTFKGTLELHRRPRQGRHRRSRPRRRAPHRRAARRRAQRDGDGDLRHPHPPRPFAGGAGGQGARPAPPSTPKVRTAPRGRCTSASTIRSIPAATATSCPTSRSRTARWSAATAGRIEAVTTPGHTANHMAYALQGEQRAVRRRSCDGLGDLDRGAARRRHERLHGLAATSSPSAARQIYFPGHGPAIHDASRFVNYYILHRKAREASILHRLAKGETDIPSIVRAIYIGIDPRLTGAAGLSVLAHWRIW